MAVACKTSLAMGALIQPWVRPIAESTPFFEEGLRAGLATGDLQFLPYLLFSRAHLEYVGGTPLARVDQRLGEALGWAASTHNQWARDSIHALRVAVRALRDEAAPGAEERAFLDELTRRDNRSSLCVYHCYRAQRRLLAGEPAANVAFGAICHGAAIAAPVKRATTMVSVKSLFIFLFLLTTANELDCSIKRPGLPPSRRR
jgi:predicted ATPase